MVATIKSLEHTLGFKWKAHGGMHKATETPFPLIEQAIEELTEQLFDARVSNKHVIANVHELDVIDEHFDHIGPELWPDEGSDRNEWLVDANEENFGGLYPRNLYFSVPEDYDLCVQCPYESRDIRSLALTVLGSGNAFKTCFCTKWASDCTSNAVKKCRAKNKTALRSTKA